MGLRKQEEQIPWGNFLDEQGNDETMLKYSRMKFNKLKKLLEIIENRATYIFYAG
jgi:hypothetical protein